jgi:adenosylmethionine-8-amino-7-oxononanoate aminotransferase
MSFGAWSATGETAYWRNFGPRAPRFAHIAQPAQDDFDAAAAVEEAIVREGPDTVAAFIAEPVSLPSRITIPPSNYWPRVRKICDKYDVLLVFDEVVTGFGRTGKWFAGEHWNVEPDLIILSKGITSGYLPLGALGMSEEFAASIPSTREPILHGFTTGGHPVACDVALRNIEIIEQERLVENAEHIGTYLRDQLDALGRRSNSLANVRGLGVLAGADLMADRAAAEPFSADVRIGEWIIDRLRQERTIMRAYGETLAIGLPLSATQADVDELLRRLSTALDAVPTDLRKPALVSP